MKNIRSDDSPADAVSDEMEAAGQTEDNAAGSQQRKAKGRARAISGRSVVFCNNRLDASGTGGAAIIVSTLSNGMYVDFIVRSGHSSDPLECVPHQEFHVIDQLTQEHLETFEVSTSHKGCVVRFSSLYCSVILYALVSTDCFQFSMPAVCPNRSR